MKVLIIGNPDRYEKFRPDLPVYDQCEKTFCPRGTFCLLTFESFIVLRIIAPAFETIHKTFPSVLSIFHAFPSQ